MLLNIKIVVGELRSWFEGFFIINLPGNAGVIIRQIYWSRLFNKASSLRIGQGCRFVAPNNMVFSEKVGMLDNCYFDAAGSGNIRVGSRVGINRNVIVDAAESGEIIIGDDVLIGPNVVIRASNHEYKIKDIPINKQGHSGGSIIIEDDVWLGANSVVLSGVRIGKGAVVAASAVVTKDVPSYALVVGIPAEVKKNNCRV